MEIDSNKTEHGVALTGRNRTGPTYSVGRPSPTRPAGPAASSVINPDRLRRQTTDAILGGPVIMQALN